MKVRIIGGTLAVALSGISILCCYVFGTHLAPGDEGRLYGALGAVADAFQALLPLCIAGAIASGQKARAIVGALIFAICTAYSFTSEMGLYAMSRDAQKSTATAGNEQYK